MTPAAAKTGPMLQPSISWLGDDCMPATQETAAEIGKRLAALRKERGITQVELAERLGLSQSMMSDYERGGLRLHGELILQIVSELGITSDELLGVNGAAKVNGKAPKRATRTKRFRTRLERIEALPKRDRDALMRTIDAFLTKGA